jgi:hypothetical protein
MAVTAVIQHHVADYQVWRKAYDGFGDVQKAGGVTRQSVYRATDDPNKVLIMHGFATRPTPKNSSLAPSCAMLCSRQVSRASRESRSTRTRSLPGKPESLAAHRHRCGCRADPAARWPSGRGK